VIYRVRSGDRLATLIEATDAETTEVLRVNCLSSTAFLIVGSTLYLPRQPFPAFSITPAPTTFSAAPTSAPQQPPGDDDDDDDNGDDSGGDDDGGDDDGDDGDG
jgi:hypothetical protein